MIFRNPWTKAMLVLPLGICTFMVFYSIMYITSSVDTTELPFPSDLEEAKKLYAALGKYNQDHSWHVLEVFILSYIFKQAFNIPGSTMLNILSGGLFGDVYGTILCSLCGAIGATLNYLISNYFFKDLVLQYFHHDVAVVSEMVSRHRRHGLIFYLVSVRVLPIMPNFLLNAIFPILGVPIRHFFFSVLIGQLPFQYACARSGLVLSNMSSMYDILDWDTTVNLFWMAILFLIPAVLLQHFTPQFPTVRRQIRN